MTFIEKAKQLLKDWEVYYSGGGCYHAMKDFKSLDGQTVGVEVHWSGSAQMYHLDDGPEHLATSTDVFSDLDIQSNYLPLVYTGTYSLDVYKCKPYLDKFKEDDQKEIVKSMVEFEKLYMAEDLL